LPRPCGYPGRRQTVVRALVEISGEQALTHRLPQLLEPVTDVSDHREVCRDGGLALRQVMDRDDGGSDNGDTDEDQGITRDVVCR
jgi:hypothetical protein